jgi:hypothetical protein
VCGVVEKEQWKKDNGLLAEAIFAKEKILRKCLYANVNGGVNILDHMEIAAV